MSDFQPYHVVAAAEYRSGDPAYTPMDYGLIESENNKFENDCKLMQKLGLTQCLHSTNTVITQCLYNRVLYKPCVKACGKKVKKRE